MHKHFSDQLPRTAYPTKPHRLALRMQRSIGLWKLFPALLGILACAFAALSGFAPNLVHAAEQPDVASTVVADVASLSDPSMTTREFSQRIVPLTRSELGEVSQVWLKLAQEEVARITSIDLALPDSEEADRERLEADLKDAVRRQDRLFRKFGVLVNEWEAKGGKPEEVAEYRQYIAAVRRKQAEVYDASTFWKLFKT